MREMWVGATKNIPCCITSVKGHGDLKGDINFGSTTNLKDTTGTAGSLTVKITGSTGIDADTITAAGIESVTINSDDSATTTGSTQHTLTLPATSATTVTITGDAGADTINAAAAIKAVTVSSGAGNGTITTGVDVDVINASDSYNTVTFGTGLDKVTFGTGNNTHVVTGHSSGNIYVELTGVNKGDNMNFEYVGTGSTFTTAATVIPHEFTWPIS